MRTDRKLPREFLEHLSGLEASYLAEDDPIRQSGFGGGPERWRAEREPILEAVKADGDFLDVGCANGYSLECLIEWAGELGITLIPYGLDCGARLVELARQRFPQFAENFFVGNAWDWQPPRQFGYVYSLHDCVPEDYLNEYVQRLLDRAVAPGGRLILGVYGRRSEGTSPFDVAGFLKAVAFGVVGVAQGGEPPITNFAWVNK